MMFIKKSADFNPRSLAGATAILMRHGVNVAISIHAPLRERLGVKALSTLGVVISIHAPLRERP